MKPVLIAIEALALGLAGAIAGYLLASTLFALPASIAIGTYVPVPVVGGFSMLVGMPLAVGGAIGVLQAVSRQRAYRWTGLLLIAAEGPAVWKHSNIDWLDLANRLDPFAGEPSWLLTLAATVGTTLLTYLAYQARNVRSSDEDLQARGVTLEERKAMATGYGAMSATLAGVSLVTTLAVFGVAFAVSSAGGLLGRLPWTEFVVGLAAAALLAALVRHLRQRAA